MYVTTHQKAHNELLYLEEPIPETKKVTDFITGISAPALSTAQDHVDVDPLRLNSFQECQQYFKTVLLNQRAHNSTSNVLAVNIQQQRTFKRGVPKGKSTPGSNDSVVHDKHYAPAAWNALSAEQKTEVMKLRKDKKKQKVASTNVIPTAVAPAVAAVRVVSFAQSSSITDTESTVAASEATASTVTASVTTTETIPATVTRLWRRGTPAWYRAAERSLAREPSPEPETDPVSESNDTQTVTPAMDQTGDPTGLP